MPELEKVRSADARARASPRRPIGRFARKRKLQGRGGNAATQRRRSGELRLQPLAPKEDEVRGTLAGIVAKPEILSALSRSTEVEVPAR